MIAKTPPLALRWRKGEGGIKEVFCLLGRREVFLELFAGNLTLDFPV